MNILSALAEKESRLVIGLMSGTSADGIDAALCRISGCSVGTKAEQLAFLTVPFAPGVRERILLAASGSWGGSHELCRMNFFLGELMAEACIRLCESCGVPMSSVDLIGSHGQTVRHIPKPEDYLGKKIAGTMQIGEAAVIAERTGRVVISDFRVRDMAAGGQGAPLVPYTEYLLYRREEETIALQNIGGIGNLTLLPAGCSLEEVSAFDTGPGNMVMDALARRISGGRLSFDEGGRIAAAGRVREDLLSWMLQDPYLKEPAPKTTGRERYGEEYVDRLLKKARELGIPETDVLTTATRFTAECIRVGIRDFARPTPKLLVIGGGGSRNPVLMEMIGKALPECRVVTNEELGMDSDAKEAVAFAILANEALFCLPNNAVGATGAAHPVVMGKISF